MAMLVDLADGEDPEALSDAIRLARAKLALSALRTAGRRNGTNQLTPDEIAREIRATRAARKIRRQGVS